MTGQGELEVRPREAVAGLAPYVPGRHAEAVKRQYGLDEVTKLASNENPFGPSPRAVAAARQALEGVHAYPDGASLALRDRLAEQHGLARENVVVGNGSDEIILLLALSYLEPGAEAILAAPPYSIHRTAVVASGGTPIGVPLRAYTHDLEAMAGVVTDRTGLVFIANPHNPTGTFLDAAALRRFVEALPPWVLLAVDEAYHEFVDDVLRHTARDLLDDHPNVVTMRTFSKTYGLAGLRAGYALAHPEVVATLDRIRPPFGLNAVAQAAALAALDDHEYVARVVAETRAGRERLLEIARKRGLEVVPSQANFVVMRAGDSTSLSEALLRRGVIVRPGENLGLPGWIRVSVGTADEIERFAAALEDCRPQREAMR
jgi:histidinol-phosphate aminotransferase